MLLMLGFSILYFFTQRGEVIFIPLWGKKLQTGRMRLRLDHDRPQCCRPNCTPEGRIRRVASSWASVTTSSHGKNHYHIRRVGDEDVEQHLQGVFTALLRDGHQVHPDHRGRPVLTQRGDFDSLESASVELIFPWVT